MAFHYKDSAFLLIFQPIYLCYKDYCDSFVVHIDSAYLTTAVNSESILGSWNNRKSS